MISILILFGLLGLIVGSFLNVVIYRLPIILNREWRYECMEFLRLPHAETKTATFNLAFPNSHCPYCKHPIKVVHNIPVLGFLLLRGKCFHCKRKISLQYPFIELCSCVLAVLVIAHFGLNLSGIFALIFSWSLLTLVAIDYRHLILPDNLTMPLLWLGLLLNTRYLFATPIAAIIGAVSGYVFLWIVGYAFKKLRKLEGMGHGDFKLLAMFGAWLGWQNLPFIIFVASLLGTIVGLSMLVVKKYTLMHKFPFGPYLAISGWIALLWGSDIINWYLSFIGYH